MSNPFAGQSDDYGPNPPPPNDVPPAARPDPFASAEPTPDMLPRFSAVAQACAHTYAVILANAPRSAERMLAIRALQQARMWANAAISGVQVEH